MNEPADFSGDFYIRPEFTPPSDVMMDGDGRPRSMDAYHNVYGLLMCRATRHGAEEGRPGKRPFVLTRAGAAGIQRYAAVWTGDNHSWWEHLAASVPMLCGMGVSGLPFVGADAGGFQENASPELFARWIAAASMTPFFRGHSVCDSDPHEPWSFGERTLEISRTYLRLRYALLPYIYTAFRNASLTGLPVMAPLFLRWPEDERARVANYQHLFGPDLLVAPVVLPDQSVWPVYLPEGRWFDYWTGEEHSGPSDILVEAPLEKLPLFVRGGAVIPREEPRLSTEDPRMGPLYIDIYPDEGGSAEGELYEDAGEGWEYVDGAFTVVRFRYADGSLTIGFDRYGYEPRWEQLVVRVFPGEVEGALPASNLRIPFPTEPGSWDM
jgi:alpha-glucosidase